MRVAAIDVGTNSILLLVIEDSGNEVRVVEDRCHIEGLGRGVHESGRLRVDAIERTLAAVDEYAEVLKATRPDVVCAVGTQALRAAENSAAFVEPAEARLGCTLEIIAGPREAELVYRAVTHSFPQLANRKLLVCDVGGGSTEMISGQGGRVDSLVSLPIGSMRLTERFLPSDPPTEHEVAQLLSHLDQILGEQQLVTGATLVGTAGTVTSLAAVAGNIEPYDADRVHGMRLRRAAVSQQLSRYLATPIAGRREIRGLVAQRAEWIAAGAAIVDKVMQHCGADSLLVSDRGVRWGLAIEMLENSRP